MAPTSEFMSFITRYAKTALDLVLFLQPKRFVEAAQTQPDRHMEPLLFLFVSLGLSTIVGFTFASILLEGEDLAALGRIGIGGTAVVIAAVWLINFVLVFVGKAVALLLHIDSTLHQLVDAYSYSSVFFPFFVAASQAAFFTNAEPLLGLAIFAAIVHILFIAFLITMMGRVSQMTGPKFAKFVVVMSLAVLGISTLLGWGAARREQTSSSSNTRNSIERVGVESGEVIRDSATCNTEVLYGTVDPNGITTTAWFEWGLDSTLLEYATPDQTFLRKSHYRQTLKLLPSAALLPSPATVYWRAVAWNANGSSSGRIKSFTIRQCTY